MPKRKFDPEWDLVYLIDADDYRYAVIKKPEHVFGLVEKDGHGKELEEDYDQLYVQEGCIVHRDGRWYYFRLKKPMKYEDFKRGRSLVGGNWMDSTDDPRFTPEGIFVQRINGGHGTVGHPAPVFQTRLDESNNWMGFTDFPPPAEVPENVTSEMLGDLIIAHMMLSDYLQEGVEDPSAPKKAAR
jgi:hypothetical protein